MNLAEEGGHVTERLYYTDPYAVDFSARVVERLTVSKRPAVVLDRTCFYPESGGQPGDRGDINGIAVLDTLERDEDHAVVHVLAAPLASNDVQGTVDRSRRFDLMQQHTGQHILSQAAERLLNAETVSFHLGDDSMTVDLATDSLTAEQAAALEDAANAVVFQDLPVTCAFVTADELARMPLRKPPKVAGPVRIVEVQGYDWSPCGGTHVATAGQVGLVVIRKWERRGAAVRVDFACGGRALADYRWKNAAVNRLAAGLSVRDREMADTVERLLAEASENRRLLNFAREQLLDHEAAALVAETAGPPHLVVRSLGDRSAEEVRRLAQRLAGRPGVVALLGSLSSGKANLIFARSADLGYDMNVLLKAACALMGGRGGGTPALAQGGGGDIAALDQALETAASMLKGS
jgi:alanyl-tRNA synthetase